MDPALLRERELFKQRALVTPNVENKKKKASAIAPKEDGSKKKSKPVLPTQPRLDMGSYKSMPGSSQYKFSVLAKIVKYMKKRHQDGEDHPLTLEYILDETNQLDVGSKVRQWLATEALQSNPKIEVSVDGYIFKPPYKIMDRKSLLRLLKQHDMKGMGGVMLEDIQESLPNHEKALKQLQNEVIYITRPMDKKKVVFYNDKTATLSLDEEFQKAWRAVAVDGIDDSKIDDYLEKQGIRSMQDQGKKLLPIKRKKAANRKKHNKKPRDNEHMADVLENYDE